jgi:hypothetical protein
LGVCFSADSLKSFLDTTPAFEQLAELLLSGKGPRLFFYRNMGKAFQEEEEAMHPIEIEEFFTPPCDDSQLYHLGSDEVNTSIELDICWLSAPSFC